MLSLRSKITQTVLRYFLLHEESEVYVSELSRRLSLESGNLTRKLGELETEGILKSRWQGSQRYYSLNSDFALLQEYKNIIRKTIGFEPMLQNALKKISGIKRAVLFGSYARQKMDSASDIDLLVVGSHDTVALQKEIAQLQMAADREINLISMSPREYDNKRLKDPFLKAVHKRKKIILI